MPTNQSLNIKISDLQKKLIKRYPFLENRLNPPESPPENESLSVPRGIEWGTPGGATVNPMIEPEEFSQIDDLLREGYSYEEGFFEDFDIRPDPNLYNITDEEVRKLQEALDYQKRMRAEDWKLGRPPGGIRNLPPVLPPPNRFYSPSYPSDQGTPIDILAGAPPIMEEPLSQVSGRVTPGVPKPPFRSLGVNVDLLEGVGGQLQELPLTSERVTAPQRIPPSISLLPSLTWLDKASEIRNNPAKLIPFVSSGIEIFTIGKLLKSASDWEAGREVSKEDLLALKEYVDRSQRDTDWGYKVADIIANLVPFAGEFVATGGIFAVGKTAAVKASSEALKRLATKTGLRILEGRLAQYGVQVAGTLAGGTLRTIPAGITRIPASSLEKQLQAKLTGNEESVWQSALKAFGEHWVEVVSESTGGLFSPLTTAAKGQMVKLGLLQAFQKANPGKNANDLRMIAEKLGYHGILEEMLEERVADVGYGVLAPLGLSDQRFNLPSLEQLSVELVSFSIPGVAMKAIDSGLGRRIIADERGSIGVPEGESNPYLNMPIERVRKDAEYGVKLAKEALAEIEGKIKPVPPAEALRIGRLYYDPGYGESGEVDFENGNIVRINVFASAKDKRLGKDRVIIGHATDVLEARAQLGLSRAFQPAPLEGKLGEAYSKAYEAKYPTPGPVEVPKIPAMAEKPPAGAVVKPGAGITPTPPEIPITKEIQDNLLPIIQGKVPIEELEEQIRSVYTLEKADAIRDQLTTRLSQLYDQVQYREGIYAGKQALVGKLINRQQFGEVIDNLNKFFRALNKVEREMIPITPVKPPVEAVPTPAPVTKGVEAPGGVPPAKTPTAGVPPSEPPTSIPAVQERLAQVNAEEVAQAPTPITAKGGAPPKPPKDWTKVKGSNWDRYNNSLPDPTPTVRPPIRDRLTKGYRRLEQLATDELARLNKQGWEAEVNAAMVRAAPGQAAEMYRETMVNVSKAINGNTDLIKNVDDYLMLRHQLEVIKATGRKTFTLVKKGKIRRFTSEQIQLLFAQMKDILGPEQYAQVKQAAAYVPEVYHAILKQSEEITPAVAQGLIQKYPWYNPLMYEQEGSTSVANLNKLSPRMVKELSEYNVDKQPVTPLMALPQSIMRRVKANSVNDAKKAIAHGAFGNKELAGLVEIVDKKPEGAFIDFFENGQRKYLKLNKGAEWIAKDIELLSTQPKDAVRRFARGVNNISRAAFTTYNPAFVAANTIFDATTAWFREGITPPQIAQAYYHAVRDLFTEDAVMNQFRLSGADISGFFREGAAMRSEFLKADKAGNLVLRNPKSLKRYINPFNLIKDLGHAGEAATRRATLTKALKEGVSAKEATLRARRVTIDFDRMGQASRVLNDYYIFFNAGVQGFALPFRTMRDNPRSILRLAVFLSAIAGATAYNLSYDEYKDVPDSIKYNSFLVMLPSNKYDKYGKKVPRYLTLIPMLREFSLFSAPIVYAMGKIKSEQPDLYSTMPDAFGYWYPAWSPLSMITGTAGFELPTQFLQTWNEIRINQDTYRSKPIIDDEMALLPAKEQYDEYTSHAAITVGQALNYSPKKLDFIINNLFGVSGREVLQALDTGIKQIDNEQIDPRIAGLVSQLREILTTVKPDEIPLAREKFLNDLAVEDRTLVLNMERLSSEKIPIISNILARFYKERGGQVYQTARSKALAQGDIETPDKALVGLQESAVSNAKNFLADKITKEQYDKERTRYRAYYSGARSIEWRQAQQQGAVSSAEVEKFMPEGWKRTESQQALSAFYEIRDKLVNATSVLDAEAWDRIEQTTERELRDKFPQEAVSYALTHVNDWIYDLPEPARSVELRRLQGIADDTWWDDYRGPSRSRSYPVPYESPKTTTPTTSPIPGIRRKIKIPAGASIK